MRVLTEGPQLTVAIMAAENSGTGRLVRNWLIHSVTQDPADMLVYGPTEAMVRAYVKAEIEPAIDARPEMAVTRRVGRAARDLEFKDFGRMWAQFLPATYNNLINKSASRIAIGGLDACDRSTGDPYALADIRRQTFGTQSRLLVESYPGLGGGDGPEASTAGIISLYANSDRRMWYWPCPHCNRFWAPYPIRNHGLMLEWPRGALPDEIRDAARMICPCCGWRIEDIWRSRMNAEGVWVGAGQRIDARGHIIGKPASFATAGFWISGLMSSGVSSGIGTLAHALDRAGRRWVDGSGTGMYRDTIAKKFGWPCDVDMDRLVA